MTAHKFWVLPPTSSTTNKTAQCDGHTAKRLTLTASLGGFARKTIASSGFMGAIIVTAGGGFSNNLVASLDASVLSSGALPPPTQNTLGGSLDASLINQTTSTDRFAFVPQENRLVRP